MTIVRKSLLATALVLIVIAVGITWLVASESGTRWLLGRASGYLPQELELVDVRGSLLRGVSIASLDWVSEATRLQIGPTFVDIQLLPLFGRQLVIDELDVARVDVRMIGGGEPADDNGLPEVNLPLAVSIASSSVRQISIARGDVERTIDAIVLVARLRNSNLRLSKLELRSDWLDLDAHGQVQLADRYRSDIDAGWQWKDAEAGPFAGQLRIAGDLREYALNHTLATPVTVTSSGVISYESGSIDTDLLHEWASLEWPLEQRTLYSSRGTLRIKGNTDIFSLDLDANARLDDQPEVQLTLTGDANSESMRVLIFEAMTPHARLLANGDVRWFPGRSFDFTYKLAELDPAFVVDSIVGTIGLEGSVTGIINDDTPDIELQIARIDGDINGNSVQGSGALHLDGTDLSISDTQLQVGSNSVRVDGGLGQSLSLVADFDVANVAEIIPDAAGSILGQASLRGPRDRPDVQINMAVAAFAWEDYS